MSHLDVNQKTCFFQEIYLLSHNGIELHDFQPWPLEFTKCKL